ncbi:hypothetical protein [Nostoc flagelliforme]|uniref:hypothetical protein n=1 Tax=Nostoc flagelliforme TaxID=1306274 RepID=UPI001F553C9B|nr:hypothetical protein [Nostoc flagelliforme]
MKSKASQVAQLVLVSLSDPTTFNYAINDSPYSVFSLIYKGLIDENVMTSKLEPGLAESWPISADKKQIIFTLKTGLK